MPTYDYKCDACDLIVEIVRSMSDESEQLCEKCQKPMRVVIGNTGVVYNGEGWAKTDRRGNGTDIYLD